LFIAVKIFAPEDLTDLVFGVQIIVEKTLNTIFAGFLCISTAAYFIGNAFVIKREVFGK
jgi:hypothetical protein